ncbi:MAG TPA: chemotaxis response regulator protein-glutamate methylesterase [Anaeromyxobacteraceae bacterium]|nr:chemotaxis response regulator protein-glutamate methylesterase [Anaeromyxobacteraceae bacterium]
MAINVLVVDDSAVVRTAMSQILGRVGMYVQTASDPIIALQKLEKTRPDVILLDIEMPRMDGLTFLRKVMVSDPIPVVVCSGLAGPGTEIALHALEEGAVEIVTKPRLGLKGFLEESATRIVHAVRAGAQARVRPRLRLPNVPKLGADAVVPIKKFAIRETTHKVVVIGASTGGTEALREFLVAMPPDAPGIAIVQHMPEVFTAQFAKRLNEICRIEVKEAETNDRLVSGRALIAPGNHHLAVRRSGALYFVDVLDGPPVKLHRPSVEVLFRSAAQAAGRNAVGVIMTGMGDDGADGMVELKQAGAHTIAQDETTSVVFGMPKEAIERGGVDEVLPLPRIAGAVLKWAQ